MRRVAPQRSDFAQSKDRQASLSSVRENVVLPAHNWRTMRFLDPELDIKFSCKYQKLRRLRPVRQNTLLFVSVTALLLAERARQHEAYNHPVLWVLVALTLGALAFLRQTMAAARHHAREDAHPHVDDNDESHDRVDEKHWQDHPSRAALALVQKLTVAVTALLTMALVAADVIVAARMIDAAGDLRTEKIDAMRRSFWSETLYLTLLFGVVVPSMNVRVHQFSTVFALFLIVFYVTHFTQRLDLVREEPVEAALLVPATMAYFSFFGYTVIWQTEYMRMRIFWRETQVNRRVWQLRLKSMNMQQMIHEVIGDGDDVPPGSGESTRVGKGAATSAATRGASVGAPGTGASADDGEGSGKDDSQDSDQDKRDKEEEVLTAAAAAAAAAMNVALNDSHAHAHAGARRHKSAAVVDMRTSRRTRRATQRSMHLWTSNDTERQRSSLCAMANLVETGALADTLVTAFSGLRGQGPAGDNHEVDEDEEESVQKALKLLTHYRQAGAMLMHRRMSRNLQTGLASAAQLNSIQVGLNAIQVSQQWLRRVAGEGISTAADKSGGKQVQVFLGGSCNPTTWREDVAIPTFESKGISYYNPQVDNWTPDLAVVEAEQKESAQVLLFVIDAATRAIASILEATEYICRGRVVVLSITDVPEGSSFPGADPASANELKDINRGRCYLREVADRHGVAYFKSEQRACDEVIRLLTLPPTPRSPLTEVRRYPRRDGRHDGTTRKSLSASDLDSMPSIGEVERGTRDAISFGW